MKPSLLIALVAFNEAPVLDNLLGRIQSVMKDIPVESELLVVNDGSTDGIGDICKRHATQLINHACREGQGRGDQSKWAFLQKSNYEFTIEMDADGQHAPEDIPEILAAFGDPAVDAVQGTRSIEDRPRGVPLLRRLMLPSVNRMIRRATGYGLSDPLCGFRAYRVDRIREVIPKILAISEPEYQALYVLALCRAHGVRFREVPVADLPRAHSKSRKGMLRYAFGIARGLVAAGRCLRGHE